MAAKIKIKCLVASLNIRKGPGTSHAATGKFLNQGQVIGTKSTKNGWYELEDGSGWVSGGASYVKVITDNKNSTPTNANAAGAGVKIDKAGTETIFSVGMDKKVLNMLASSAKKTGRNELNSSTRLFGGPHQFISETDYRVNTGVFSMGRKYAETMMSAAPILYLMPCKPNYLPDMNETERNAFTDFLIGKEIDTKQSVLDKILDNKDYRYYTTLADYSTYIRYVNLLCRAASIYMGVGANQAPGTTTKYRDYNWANWRLESSIGNPYDAEQSGLFNLTELKTDIYNGLFGEYQYVQYYADPSISFNESISNVTGQSKVEGYFDTAEGIVKELAFLMDAGAISDNGAALQSFSSGVDAIRAGLNAGSGGFFDRILGMTSNVLSGANMSFPQIWTDSSYNKSYNITINLISPYGDPESIFINCIAPMLHLVALAFPRQSTSNSYSSPFLLKAFSKGWFSCEMGIIENMSIEKSKWTADGLPRQIKINLSVKDLYSNLMVTPNNRPDLFFQNLGLMEFLAVTCGVNITKPQFALQIDTLVNTLTKSVTDIPSNIARAWVQNFRNSMENLIKPLM